MIGVDFNILHVEITVVGLLSDVLKTTIYRGNLSFRYKIHDFWVVLVNHRLFLRYRYGFIPAPTELK